jgi:hypothetical protein
MFNLHTTDKTSGGRLQISNVNRKPNKNARLDGGPSGCAKYNDEGTFVSGYHTLAAVSKMASLSPEISPTTTNKVQSERAVSLRMLSSIVSMDLNSVPLDAQYTNSPIAKKIIKVGRLAKSHWSLGAATH